MKGLGFVLISLLPLCDWCHEQDGQYAGHTVKGPQVSRRAPEEQHKGIAATPGNKAPSSGAQPKGLCAIKRATR